MSSNELQKTKKLRLFADVMGLSPWRERWRQTKIALRGEEDVPPSRFGLSSLSQLRPRYAIPLWMGRQPVKGKVLVTNLFNHRQTPIEDGWSVKKTQLLDFRGRKLTYDSHNGTDFSIPIGTNVLTAAPGVVVCVKSEFNRGGLKVFVDHGRGLMTCYAHLARSLVQTGDVVSRGQVIALSGYSGLDALVTFPFGVPHIHFNVWLNCEPIDPFPYGEEASLWCGGTLPTSWLGEASEESSFSPSVYREEAIQEALDVCKTPKVRERLQAIDDVATQAAETIIEMNYYPTRFSRRVNLYDETYPREPRLDLPFSHEDFDGLAFVDDL
ncbi:MAG: M23 family metallopeptidase [Deltaproteobacteria bacterium]|nr:MAG: M23 family metallopeptidase [Deltaproteobacteria bacterium]